MKIIISSFDDVLNPDFAGGGARAVQRLAKHLALKHDISIVSGDYPDSKNIIEGIKYKHIGPKTISPKLRMFIYDILLPFQAKKNDYDLWIESFTPPISSSFVPLFSKKPVIGLAHMLSARDMQRKYKLPFPWIEKKMLKIYKYVICVNNADANLVRSVNKNAVVKVISNGVVIPKSKKIKPKHILFLGRIEMNQKGLDLLLRAYKNVASLIRYKLVIVGNGTETEVNKLKKQIKALGLSEYVNYVGPKDGDEKQELIDESLFMVAPSRYETFGLVLLEAFASHKSVVCFDIAGLEWTGNDTCLKAQPFNVSDLANKLRLMADNSKLRLSLQKQAYKLAGEYSWDKVFVAYDEFIDAF